ncbi:MAG: SAM-dependent methyltransferase [Deltaproteobacteria bacterium]|nr:SAM-dependent methyltransferase [Deltaproteobacteria bacterium]
MTTLRIIGLGINNITHLTIEGVEQLKRAKKVLYLATDPKGVEKLLKQYGVVSAESLQKLYRNLEQDETNYHNLEAKILKECCKSDDVALLLPGHPQIGVTLVQRLRAKERERNFKIIIIPGISSFDCMLNDLNRDPLEYGAAIIDANRLLLFEYQMEAAIDYYIYHVCSIGTSQISMQNAALGNRIDLLNKYLLKFYDAKHPVTLISSSTSSGVSSEVFTGSIGKLDELLPHIHFGTTLFIPGVRRKYLNKDYLALLQPKQGKDHVASTAVIA